MVKYFLNGALVIMLGVGFAKCARRIVKPRPALTDLQKAVKILGSEQKTSLRLNEDCKAIGRMQKIYGGEYDMRVTAGQKGANVVQVIYSSNQTSSGSYGSYSSSSSDVRFWSCME